MKKIKVEDAVGMELCHDITAMNDNFKGAAFKRGHVVTEVDIPKLLDIGKRTVFVWEAEADEIHEEDAALRMAAMAPVENTHYTEPSEGKVLLVAEKEGMFRVNTELLKKINSIGDITISTLPDHYHVHEGDRMASMRIVPLVTKEAQIIGAEKLCESEKLLDLKLFQHKKVGIIITGSEIYTGRIKDKFEPVIRAKLSNYPCDIIGASICDDDLDMMVNTAKEYIESGADFLIFSGGMSVDPDDLTPTAIRMLGADVVSHGVPSQPGNMTLVAYIGDIAVAGVPGAAIKLSTTILDALLPQFFTGEKITKADLVNLGDGGLCQLCKPCHFPNCTFGRY